MRDRAAIAVLAAISVAGAAGLLLGGGGDRPAALTPGEHPATARAAPADGGALPWEGLQTASGDPAPATQPRDPAPAAPAAPVRPGAAPAAPARPAVVSTADRRRITELERLGQGATAHLDELRTALRSADGVVRLRAAELLARLGDPGVAVLLNALRSQDEKARLAAAFGLAGVLGQAGSAEVAQAARQLADALSGWLAHDDPATRVYGAEAMGRLGTLGADGIPALLSALTDDEWPVRRAAARSLRLVGAGAESVAPLARLLEDGSESVQREAIESLGALGPAAAGAVDNLVRLLELDDDHWDLRAEAARTLGRIGPAAERAVPALLKMLQDTDDPGTAREAVQALGALGAQAARPAILEALSREHPVVMVQIGAARALGRLGQLTSAEEAILRRLAAHRDVDLRAAAAEALGFAGGATSRRGALESMAGDADPAVRGAALEGLARAGLPPGDAVALIARGLTDTETTVRQAASRALARSGPTAAAALVTAVRSDDWRVSNAAAGFYRSQRAAAAAAVPGLRRLLGHADPGVRKRATRNLGYLGEAAVPALSDLVKLLDDKHVLAEAAQTLGALGAAAAPALPALRKRLAENAASGDTEKKLAGGRRIHIAGPRTQLAYAIRRIEAAIARKSG